MIVRSGALLLAALLAWSAPAAAQTAADPTGHWEGTVTVPTGPMPVEFDITKDAKGAFSGTFNQPAQGLKGLPLGSVTVKERSVQISMKTGVGEAIFSGTLAADGKTLAGDLNQGGQTFPFTVTRTGDAKSTELPKSAAVGKEFEGTWNGLLSGARPINLVLKITNQPDGTASGTIQAVEGGPMEFPIVIKQKAKELTIEVPAISGSFTGTLNAEGTELAGTWTQGPGSAPLVFKRPAK